MKKLLLALALALAPSYVFAADNFAATAGSGLTFGAKDAAGILYTRFIGCDNTTVSQCWAVDASGRLTVNINGTVTVTGTVAATQSGTWIVQPGNTANTTAWLVTGTGGTFPIATWAGGTLGAMAAYGTSPGAVLVPGVNAFVTNTLAAGSTNADGIATSTSNASPTQAYGLIYNGTTWDRMPGAAATGVKTSYSSPYPVGSTAYTASATGTTAATTATLAGASSVTTYICGFSIRANATAAATGTATVTGVITATLSYVQWTAPLASGIGVVEQIYSPCVPASGTNQSVAVVSAAPGSGGTVSVVAWGYKL